MNKRRKYIGVLILIAVISAAIFAYREYNRKPADLSGVEALEKIAAVKLMEMYETDEQKANQRYLGKPIDVSGMIADINNQHDTMVNVLLGKADDIHKVSCLLDVNHIEKVRKYKAGDSITLRGICTGYLIDVEINRCVVIP